MIIGLCYNEEKKHAYKSPASAHLRPNGVFFVRSHLALNADTPVDKA